MKISLYFQPGWVRDRVRSCKECGVLGDDDTAFLCGWHEYLAADDEVVKPAARRYDPDNRADLLDWLWGFAEEHHGEPYEMLQRAAKLLEDCR